MSDLKMSALPSVLADNGSGVHEVPAIPASPSSPVSPQSINHYDNNSNAMDGNGSDDEYAMVEGVPSAASPLASSATVPVTPPVVPLPQAASGLGLPSSASVGENKDNGHASPSPSHSSSIPSASSPIMSGIRETGGTPTKAECSLCEVATEALSLCKECSLFCCQAHSVLHMRERGNANHNMISLSKYSANSFWQTIGQQLPLMRISRNIIWENKHIFAKRGYYAPLPSSSMNAVATPLIPEVSVGEKLRSESKAKAASLPPAEIGAPVVRSFVVGGVVPTVVQNNSVFIDLHDRITAMQQSTRVYGGDTERSYRTLMNIYERWCHDHPLAPLPPVIVDGIIMASTAPSGVVEEKFGDNSGEMKHMVPVNQIEGLEHKDDASTSTPSRASLKASLSSSIPPSLPSLPAAPSPVASPVASIASIAPVASPSYRTNVAVVQRDCLDEARELVFSGRKPLLLNLASRINFCGAWDNPYLGTQEECIERRSAVYRHGMDWHFNGRFGEELMNMREREGCGTWQWRDDNGAWQLCDGGAARFLSNLSAGGAGGDVMMGTYCIGRRTYAFNLATLTQRNLVTNKVRSIRYAGMIGEYHIPFFGAVLHRGVPIIRDARYQLYQPDLAFDVDIIAAAGIDLRTKWHGKTDFSRYAAGGGSFTKSLANVFKRATLTDLNVPLFVEHTKNKIRCIYATAIMNGYTTIVLGALGCGAFCNDTTTVARCFREVLHEPLFANRFMQVTFAILGAPAIEFAQEFAHWPALDVAHGHSHILASVAAPAPSSPVVTPPVVVASSVPPLPPRPSLVGSAINSMVASSSAVPMVVSSPVVVVSSAVIPPASPPGGPLPNNHVDLASSLTLP